MEVFRALTHIAALAGRRPIESAPSIAFLLLALLAPTTATSQHDTYRTRAEGLLIGSLIGDAAGAPTEFAAPERSLSTLSEEPLTASDLVRLSSLFAIGPSARPVEPFGPWSQIPATLTDDSRFKVLFFDHLEASRRPSRSGFASEIIAWESRSDVYGAWLGEFAAAARWTLGDSVRGLPPERAWGGIPTMAGQMPFLPIAILSDSPEEAYRLTWEVNFLDNGYAKDITSALVAGLHEALQEGATWDSIERVMRETDPFGFGRVPWVPRQLNRWLDSAAEIADQSGGSAPRLFELLETRAGATTWWESWVPLLVAFSAVRVAQEEPLATLQLILEFGHDTDSYLQLAGAFVGALHGPDVFPQEMRDAVRRSLQADYSDSVERWLDLALD